MLKVNMASHNIQGILTSITKLLECAICLDLLNNPVSTKCSHKFCRFCITEFLKRNSSVPCPLCKKAVTKRSLQDQGQLNEIVNHVRSLISAYQDDSGQVFSPARGQREMTFFPCTPETIFPRGPDSRHKQKQKNVKVAQTCPTVHSPAVSNKSADRDGDGSRLHVESVTGSSGDNTGITAGTTTNQRARHKGRGTSSNQRTRSSSRCRQKAESRLEQGKEEALLQYLEMGACGLNEDFNSGAEVSPAVQRSNPVKLELKESRETTLAGFNGNENILSGDDERFSRSGAHKGTDKIEEESSGDTNTGRGRPCVIERGDATGEVVDTAGEVVDTAGEVVDSCTGNSMLMLQVEAMKSAGTESGPPLPTCSPQAEHILELTPESENGEVEVENSDNEMLLFQSQEVKAIEKAKKVKLNIYSGRRVEHHSSTQQGTLGHLQEKSDAIFNDSARVSSFDTPLHKDFQRKGQVKTYVKSKNIKKTKVEDIVQITEKSEKKIQKRSMVNTWVVKAQEATEEQSFSRSQSSAGDTNHKPATGDIEYVSYPMSDSDSNEDAHYLMRREDDILDVNDTESDLETHSPVPSPKSHSLSENRKKIFKTRIAATVNVKPEHGTHPDVVLHSSDPYEFKSSQNTPLKVSRKPVKKRGRKTTKTNKKLRTIKKVDNLPTTSEKIDLVVDASGIPETVDESEKVSKVKKRKGKHVHFDVESHEEEMSSLMNTIGEAEEYDLMFCTQDAQANMAAHQQHAAQQSKNVLKGMDEDIEPEFDERALDTLKNDQVVDAMKDISSPKSGASADSIPGDGTLSIVPATPLLAVFKQNPVGDGSACGTAVSPTPPLLLSAQRQGITQEPASFTMPSKDTEPDYIHLSGSECCSQMPLPIEKKRTASSVMKTTARGDRPVVNNAWPTAGDDVSPVKPDPVKELQNGVESPLADVEDSSGESSATEDLNLTPDNTQFEQADFNLQSEEVKRKMSRMSQDNGDEAEEMIVKSSKENRVLHSPCRHKRSAKLLAPDDILDSPVSNTLTQSNQSDGKGSVNDVENTASPIHDPNPVPESDCDADVCDTMQPSLDVVESVPSSLQQRTARRTTNNATLHLHGAGSSRTSKYSDPAVAIADSDEDAVRTDVPRCIGSEASTLKASMDDDQALDADDPDACVDSTVVVQSVVVESRYSVDDAACTSASVSPSILLKPHFGSDVSAPDVKSQGSPMLASVSVLENHTQCSVRGSSQHKRKYSEHMALSTPSTNASLAGGSSEAWSAPIVMTVDDSDEELLKVRRPKRKCFSLDGSPPLRARPTSSQAKRVERKKSAKMLVLDSEVVHDSNRMCDPPMDTGNVSGVKSTAEKLLSSKAGHNNKEVIEYDSQQCSGELGYCQTETQDGRPQQSKENISHRYMPGGESFGTIDLTPKFTERKRTRRLLPDSSDVSDSDTDDGQTSVVAGVRAVRGLAALGRQCRKSPVVTSAVSPRVMQMSGASVQRNSENVVKVSQSRRSLDSQSQGQKLTMTDSVEVIGPTPSQTRTHACTSTTRTDDGQADEPEVAHMLSDSEDSVTSVRNQLLRQNITLEGSPERTDLNKKLQEQDGGVDHRANIDVASDHEVMTPEDNSRPEASWKLQEGSASSSDEEFILCDGGAVLRKAELSPADDDVYGCLPRSSSPLRLSCPVHQEQDKKRDHVPPRSKKHFRRAMIIDSDSDSDDSCQQKHTLELEMVRSKQTIQDLEAVVPRRELTPFRARSTPDVIPASNDNDDDSDDNDDFMASPRSPSPPPRSPYHIHTDRKSETISRGFDIITKIRSPVSLRNNANNHLEPAKMKSGQSKNETSSKENTDQSGLPLVKGEFGTTRVIKNERSSSVLSPLCTENSRRRKSRSIGLITSGLGREEAILVKKFIDKLGCAFFPTFRKLVTHVIVRKAGGDDDQPLCDRTLKYFQGVMAKCWVLSCDWVRDSLSAGRALAEDQYEICGDTVTGESHFGPRRSRTTEKRLFAGFTFTCTGHSNEMPKDDMSGLLQMGGGVVVGDPLELGLLRASPALIIRCLDNEVEPPTPSDVEHFNHFYKHFQLVTVSREWVLDTISSFLPQPLDQYVLNDVTDITLPF